MFQIDFKSRRSIRDQIIDNFKQLVINGVLKAEDAVPSIANISVTLIVNPNTTEKAYLELERQGYFYYNQINGWTVSTVKINAIKTQTKKSKSRKDDYIKIKDLTKYFDDNLALDELSLTIKKGSIYGLIGVNGSGKTTLIKHIAKMYQADEGQITINNINVARNTKDSVGFMSEDMYFIPQYNMDKLSVFFENKYRENWDYARYQALVRRFGLDESHKLDNFSSGMRKQAGFIFAISATPDILLLDETLDGLDPFVRQHVMREIVKDVAERQMTVFVTSHNVNDIDGICDTIGIIDKGKMVLERDIDALRSNIHKINVAFEPDLFSSVDPYEGLNILYMEELENTDLLVVHGSEVAISAHLQSYNPLIYSHHVMSLEEIFIYEKSGDAHEIH